MLSMVNPSPTPDKFPNGLDFVIHHLLGETRVGPQEDRLVHDLIGADHFTDNAERFGAVFAKLDENRLAKEIAPKEHAVAYLLLVKMTSQVGMSEGSGWFHPKHESKPAAVGPALRAVP